MNRVLVFAGAVILVLVAVLGALAGYAIHTGTKLDASSKAYVDRVVPEIVSTWSAASLRRKASAELIQNATNDQIADTFRKFAALGKLVAYRGSRGEAKISLTPKTGRVVTAKYEASASFEHGDAVIEIGLVQKGGRWQIAGFFVKSEQLSNRLARMHPKALAD